MTPVSYADAPAPTDYAQLATAWSPYIKKVIKGQGIPVQDVDDVAQEVLVYFVSRDALGYYNPNIAPFSTFVRAYTVRRCHSYRRTLMREAQALAVSPDREVGDEDGSTFGDVFYGYEDPIAAWVLERSALASFQRHLDQIDTDLTDLFNTIMLTLHRGTPDLSATAYELTIPGLAERLGILPSRCTTLFRRLRREAAAYGLL